MARRKRRGGTRWTHTKMLAFERDRMASAPCWICGGPIDYALGYSTCDEAYEADHYIPVANPHIYIYICIPPELPILVPVPPPWLRSLSYSYALVIL